MDYYCIDIEDFKYYGSNVIFECFLFVILKIMFDDKLYYCFVVLNKIGGGISNIVKINVIGSMILFLLYKLFIEWILIIYLNMCMMMYKWCFCMYLIV